jgi:hypothetical protein
MDNFTYNCVKEDPTYVVGKGWICFCGEMFDKDLKLYNENHTFIKVQTVAEQYLKDKPECFSCSDYAEMVISEVTAICEDKQKYTEEYILKKIKKFTV